MTLLHRRREGFNINYIMLIAAQFLINHSIVVLYPLVKFRLLFP
jgi:hypothetical protein